MCVATASRCRTSSAKCISLCRGAFAAVVKATGKADHRLYALKVVTRSAYRHYYHMMNQVLQPVYHRFLLWSHVTSLNAPGPGRLMCTGNETSSKSQITAQSVPQYCPRTPASHPDVEHV